MSVSERRRQKQRAKKAKKNKARKAGTQSAAARSASVQPRVDRYAAYPIHECLITMSLGTNIGMGYIIAARKTPGGDLAVSVFLIDVYCLGVKNAMFNVLDPADYRTLVSKLAGPEGLSPVQPECARRIVEDGVRFARALGFEPHPDYAVASRLFGDLPADACKKSIAFGYQGKPLYIPGPKESLGTIERTVNTLRENCGEGNFDYVLEVLER